MNAIIRPRRDLVQEVAARVLSLKVLTTMISHADTELRDVANGQMVPGERVPAIVDGVTLGALTKPKESHKARIENRDVWFAWVKENRPEEIQRQLNATPEILDALTAMFPEAVVEVVRPAYEKAILKEAKEQGRPPGDEKGEVIPGIAVEKSTEYVSTSPLPPDAFEIVWAAVKSGELADIIADPLRELGPAPEEPAGDEGQAVPADIPALLTTPEGAAAHAIAVQGGFSDPEREARRLLRDHDPEVRERAENWLYERGLLSDEALAWLVDRRPGTEPLPAELRGVRGE